tara:strand:- start:85 stop:621 length:537 start_codon:yes stop_codon:yes gene_type:complete
MSNFTHYAEPVQKYMRTEKYITTTCMARWVILPIIFTKESLFTTYLQISPMLMTGGFYLAFFFILSHNYDGVYQYNSENKSIGFLQRQVLTSSNVGGPWLSFLNGGLNYQIEHHLFPRISHCYYPFIAPYVREFCDKRNIRYKHFPTILENIESCLKHLHSMGTVETPSGFYVKVKND